MTDRYDDKYKDQYTKETSQIHAPAELIQKTRQAVAEEEKRLQTGSMVHVLPEQQSEGEHSNSRRYLFDVRYGKIFRWALPAAAAVILIFVLNMSGILLSRGRQNSQSGSASEMEAAGSSEDGSSMNGSSEAIVEESEGFEEQNADGTETTEDMGAAGSAEESGSAESAMSGAEDSAVQRKESAMRDEINSNRNELNNLSRDISQSGQSTDSLEEADNADQYDRTSGAPGANVENSLDKEMEMEDSSSTQLLIEKVKTVPSFRNDTDTKCVVSHGISFYIAEDEDGDRVADKAVGENYTWKAYAEYNGGRYIITGPAVDQEEFLEKAAEKLVETAGES